MSLNRNSGIDYLKHAKSLIGRQGCSLNLVTGCKHRNTETCNLPCWAMSMIENRFKDHPAFPYGTEPTFHPERIKHYGGKPKLIALNFMGDVGGEWDWRNAKDFVHYYDSDVIADKIVRFAELNPEHIILLLTKNPAWYGLVEWPENCQLGFTATNNQELFERGMEYPNHGVGIDRAWVSLEPWLDGNPPDAAEVLKWVVIGGQTRPNRAVPGSTLAWVEKIETQRNRPKIFIKDNAVIHGILREYPEEWKEGYRCWIPIHAAKRLIKDKFVKRVK